LAKFLIVEARFYAELNDNLIKGARAALEDAGHQADVLTVPGTLEIPGAIALAALSGNVAEAAGQEWQAVHIAEAPDDAHLLSAAAALAKP